MTTDVRSKVQLGATWMDKNYPNWAPKINLGELEMKNCNYCIIGQAVSRDRYWEIIHKESINNDLWSIEHGFDASREGIKDSDLYSSDDRYELGQAVKDRYTELETLWTDEVLKRLM